jgi:hypothetical protein
VVSSPIQGCLGTNLSDNDGLRTDISSRMNHQLTSQRQPWHLPNQGVWVRQPAQASDSINVQWYMSYLGKVVDERDLRLCEMAHIRVADFKCVFAPLVDLGRGCSPEDVIKEHITRQQSSANGV